MNPALVVFIDLMVVCPVIRLLSIMLQAKAERPSTRR
jgi:hypothetical protein